ncbi:MAG: hypothetical protein LBL07_01870, partial [Tannerella sp.]|nr:hypothetical protein [Tannerella sp.]
SVACRVNKTPQEQLVLYVNNRWDYPEIVWGNYCKRLDPSPCYGRLTICLQSGKGAGIEQDDTRNPVSHAPFSGRVTAEHNYLFK